MRIVGKMVDHIEYIFLEHALVHFVIASKVQKKTESELLE